MSDSIKPYFFLMFKAENFVFLCRFALKYAQRRSSFRCIPCRNRAIVKNVNNIG